MNKVGFAPPFFVFLLSSIPQVLSVPLFRGNLTLIFLAGRPLIMGIVNVTPDSFSDGGLCVSTESALRHAVQPHRTGSGLAGCWRRIHSSRQHSVSVEEELRRIIPVVEALVEMNVSVSVDTSKPEVMRAAIEAGAAMINDVNALQGRGCA